MELNSYKYQDISRYGHTLIPYISQKKKNMTVTTTDRFVHILPDPEAVGRGALQVEIVGIINQIILPNV